MTDSALNGENPGGRVWKVRKARALVPMAVGAACLLTDWLGGY